MGSRSKAREQALQVLYLVDLAGTATDKALELFRSNFESQDDETVFTNHLVKGVVEHHLQIDALIEQNSEHWRLSRMPRIDRNILRLGTFELKYCPDTPPAVAIDEAIELSKKFGEGKTAAFVNGILDRISRRN